MSTGRLLASVRIIQNTCYQTVQKVAIHGVVEAAVLTRMNAVSIGHLLANVRTIQAICCGTAKRVVTYTEVNKTFNSNKFVISLI